jgi:hypothetical protein
MTAQLLIYETVVPVSAARHRDCAVEIGGNYGFSKKTNSVPLMAVEFPAAAFEYPIVFAGTKENVMPVVILGVRDNQNLYLSQDDKWDAKYIPAFVRRYPFVFSNSANGRRPMLCIDEEFSGFNREGRGQKLFGEDKKPTPYVENILKFLRDYQAQFERTQAFCQKVRELDLLESMQAQVETKSGEKWSLAGFMAVNRAKLKAIPADKLAELVKTDELELLYLHLQSMRNFSGLPNRIAVVQGDKTGPDREVVPGENADVNGSKPGTSGGGAGRAVTH